MSLSHITVESFVGSVAWAITVTVFLTEIDLQRTKGQRTDGGISSTLTRAEFHLKGFVVRVLSKFSF